MNRRASQLCISESMLRAIAGHAASEFPKECCGLLLGCTSETAIEVQLVVPAANIARMPHRQYQMDWDILAAGMTGEMGHRVVGFYHSHPDGGVAASNWDAECSWPGYVYMIVGVSNSGPGRFAAWRKPKSGLVMEFDEVSIVPTPLGTARV